MDSSIFFGGSVVAAFTSGMIALFAPCCISVMLPAYFASSFQNRTVLVAMTFVFAGGIATIILPLVLGTSADPLEVLRQKAALEHYATPLLSDPNKQVSHAYTTNRYGMTGDHINDHSFVLVGLDGNILWRADYGGAPYYFMYIPVTNLIADISHGLETN
ncbi:MAG TPA: hypothetical protein V6D29_19730 [Leptolyngbyaceae cyanobacterium]